MKTISIREKITKFLREQGKEFTSPEISKEINIPNSSVSGTLTKMVKSDAVIYGFKFVDEKRVNTYSIY